jgi:hypothetical protein
LLFRETSIGYLLDHGRLPIKDANERQLFPPAAGDSRAGKDASRAGVLIPGRHDEM